MEFDHLFICVENPKDGAEQLRLLGLTEGAANQHPGQGTENRRFIFENSFIELLFVTDQDELQSNLTSPTKLHERFASNSQEASPFGICFRPSKGNVTVPFESWSYKPKFLPPELEIAVAKSPVSEPMWFYLSFGARPDMATSKERQPSDHNCGFKCITSVKIFAPQASAASAKVVANVSGIEIFNGEEHLLQVGFDSEAQGMQKDFRPTLPLIFRW